MVAADENQTGAAAGSDAEGNAATHLPKVPVQRDNNDDVVPGVLSVPAKCATISSHKSRCRK